MTIPKGQTLQENVAVGLLRYHNIAKLVIKNVHSYFYIRPNMSLDLGYSLTEVYLEPSRTSTMGILCENS